MGSITHENVYRRAVQRLGTYILAAASATLAFAVPFALGAPSTRAGSTHPAGSRGGSAGTAASSASAPCPNAHLRPTRLDVAAVAAATVCLINRERSVQHLSPLRTNHILQSVAEGQSREMVLGDYFGDDSRSGRTPMQRLVAKHYGGPVGTASAAQNIGWGIGPYANPAALVQGWMESPPHREIILTEEFRDIGVGVDPAAPAALAEGQPGGTYTVEFGVRRG
jgi:uncharacterized protein YkwD